MLTVTQNLFDEISTFYDSLPRTYEFCWAIFLRQVIFNQAWASYLFRFT